LKVHRFRISFSSARIPWSGHVPDRHALGGAHRDTDDRSQQTIVPILWNLRNLRNFRFVRSTLKTLVNRVRSFRVIDLNRSIVAPLDCSLSPAASRDRVHPPRGGPSSGLGSSMIRPQATHRKVVPMALNHQTPLLRRLHWCG
jgi:hypothetical protein